MAKEAKLNLSEVKDNLSKIVSELEHGIFSKVILCKNGKPAIVLQVYSPPKKSLKGKWKNRVEILEGFDDIPDDFDEYT